MTELYVIGIGGTGMRCLESLVHFCGAGCFSDKIIHVLALDTDKTNGNFKRAVDAINKYKALQGGKNPLSGAICGAQIIPYVFSPDYSQVGKNTKLQEMIGRSGTDENDRKLAQLFFTENVQKFVLTEGYRAQTHLGSMLMYSSIVDAAKNPKKEEHRQLCDFVKKIGETSGDTKKCFVMGSVFGGTGASSIPVVPQAFNAAYKAMTDETKSLDHVQWGESLLTAYFTFNVPSNEEMSKESVIAKAEHFKLNSQVALSYYSKDESIRKDYKSFYVLGNAEAPANFQSGTNKTVVGGAEQTNPAHYLETLAITAAEHFFKTKFESADIQYFYRRLSSLTEADGYVSPKDLVSSENINNFALNLLTLKALAADTSDDTSFSDTFMKKEKVELPSGALWLNQSKELQEYLIMFDEWIKQIWKSANGQQHFIFKQEVFEKSGPDFFKNILNDMFLDKLKSESGFAGRQYDKTGVFGKTALDPFVKALRGWQPEQADSNTLNNVTAPLKFVYVVRDVLKGLYQF